VRSPKLPQTAAAAMHHQCITLKNASLKGLRVYLAQGDMAPAEVLPPPSPRKYWTRRGITEWLLERLAEEVPTLVGIDHGFSEVHRLKPDWPLSSMTSSAIGRPTRTSTSISFATARWEMAVRAPAVPAGGG
jgi:hypothetical protein